ncbi:MAG: S1/P1 nuclease [Propionivibrio sp.]|uniref:S1/P1 nuclease n=1 Tax=Propionivibrio sp. TaxID=2212460 RepID=UPI001A573ABA|nr:S1/P1 nuclease [Propionivibrio sp.]MBL8413287.1 S1/P1 nuclease [Propionivibrio sp.]
MIANPGAWTVSLCWRWLPFLPLMLFLPWPALAWNAAGHRLVASIAWEQLDRQTRIEVSNLLREHPDYARWLKRAGNGDADRVAFIEASTWPDDIRQDQRFYSAGVDEPTPTLPGFPDMERRRNWHYVNRPLDDTHQNHARNHAHSDPVSGLLDQQLVALAKILGSPGSPVSERSYALPWLIHLSGDAHQPLHTSIRLDAEGKWDRLGNGISVINPFNPRKNSTTLHAFWDDLPGSPWLRGERLDAVSQALSARYSCPPPSTSAQWIDESWRLARNSAYPPGEDNVPTISTEFFDKVKEIANRRIAQAGCRLADLLRELLSRK